MSAILFPNTKNPLNFFELSAPRQGQPWLLPNASALPILPKGSGYGCFVSPNENVGVPISKACPKGYYCPYFDGTEDTVPVACPPDPVCQIGRVFSGTCMPQGRYEPMLCLKSFYCPDPSTIVPCPEGYFCPRGISSPIKCQFLSLCPAGSSFEFHYGLTFIVIGIDLLLFLILTIKRIQEVKKAGMPITAILPTWLGRLLKRKQKDDIEMKEDNAGMVERIVEGYEKAVGSVKGMEFGFKGLRLELGTGKTVLKGVSGKIQSGRMTAIMGPSGAGKTTFMNVLMGKVNRTGGELEINGVVTEMQRFRKVIGYVPQEDVMHRELTVRENVLYSARVRLPRSWSNEMVEKHVDDVIEALNLTNVKHTPIGDTLTRGISGGQRKRVNVAMELVSCPLSLFLDEPTSGLDSTSALDLIQILQSIAGIGLTVVSVIHQPRVEIFEKFDDVLLIAPGGLTAYFGPVAGVKEYFEGLGFFFDSTANVADVLMDVLSGRGVSGVVGREVMDTKEIVEMWEKVSGGVEEIVVDAYGAKDGYHNSNLVGAPGSVGTTLQSVESKASLKELVRVAGERGANPFKQIVLAHNRSLLQQSRFLGAFFMESFVGMFAGFIMGISSNGSSEYVGIPKGNLAVLASSPNNWFLALYGMLVGISIALAGGPSGVKVFGEEKPVYWRETASGHNSFSYYVGKTISVFYRLTLSSLHFTALYYLLASPPIPLQYQIAFNLLNFFCVYGVAAVISMLVRRENAPLLAVVIGLFSAVFCGFGLTLDAATKGGYIFVFNLGGNRWAAESQFTLWTRPTRDVYDQVYGADEFGYVPDVELHSFPLNLPLISLDPKFSTIKFSPPSKTSSNPSKMRSIPTLFGSLALAALSIIPSVSADFHECAGVKFWGAVRDQQSPFVVWSDGNFIYDSIWGSYWYLLDHNEDCSTHKFTGAGTGDPLMIRVCIDKDSNDRQRYKNEETAKCLVGQATDNFVHNFGFGGMYWAGDVGGNGYPRVLIDLLYCEYHQSECA
ncbi:hypothetical protein HDU97_003331 [Phlyctochytrium planicorne]|nr:hypothetical protein HDU97_003331 [Phlyctochytrium planicorne]